MKISIPYTGVKNVLLEIASTMGAKVKKDCQEYRIDIPEKYGQGYIYGLTFEHGLNLFLFDCQFKENFNLVIVNNESPQPLSFNFSIKGGIYHEYANGKVHYQLNPLQGTITANPITSKQSYKFPDKVEILTTILLIDRSLYVQKIDCELEKMPKKLAEIFMDIDARMSYISQSNYSISTAQCIKKILNSKYEGLVRTTFLESKALELLSLQIKQFKDDLEAPGKQVLLRKYDINKIIKARDILIKDLVNPPNIPELAHKAGINQQKLKKGFKIIFDQTINTYLRNERLETAQLLLAEGTLSVREISTKIGYTNQGHFARRFKEKYGTLPKDYLKNLKLKVSDLQ